MSSGDELGESLRAAASGEVAALDQLIKKKVPFFDLEPVFSALLRKGDLSGIEKMLKYGYSANKMTDRDLPLNIAIEAGDFELVKLLVTRGAKVNPKVNFIFFPLANFVRRILKANPDMVPEADMKILHYLLDNGADANDLNLTSSDEISLARFKELQYVLRQHGWVSTEDRIGHGGPP